MLPKTLTALLFLFLGSVSSAFASSIFLEPGLGYSFGRYSNESSGGVVVTTQGEAHEVVLSGRFGARFAELFMAGIELQHDFGSERLDNTTTTFSTTRTQVGLFVGVRPLGLPFRAWLGWDFFDRNVVDVSNASVVATAAPDDKFSGSGVRIGASYLLGPVLGIREIALNLELQHHSYSSEERGGQTTVYPRTVSTSTIQGPAFNMLTLTISVPFEWDIGGSDSSSSSAEVSSPAQSP